MASARILVVDDSPTILKLTEMVLGEAGHRVLVAGDGESGLLTAKAERPDLVLLDYYMPDMTGFDVASAMSADTALSKIPVVIMSTRAEEVGDRFTGLPQVLDSITKPFSPDALLAVVSHTLEKSRETTPAPLPLKPPDAPAAAESATQEAPALALGGDLATIPFPDVLTLLGDRGVSGVLSLTRGETRLDVVMGQGRVDLAVAASVADEFLLGRFLVDGGHVSADALARVVDDRVAAQKDGAKVPLLGEDLVARGLVTTEGVVRAMRDQTAALVFEAIRWTSGRFAFRPDGDVPAPARGPHAKLALAVDPLVLEGIRRVDEWRVIEREISDFAQVFVRDEERLAALERGRLTRDELTILGLVDGRTTVKEIIYASKMGSFDVGKMLFRLVRSKLVRKRVAPLAV